MSKATKNQSSSATPSDGSYIDEREVKAAPEVSDNARDEDVVVESPRKGTKQGGMRPGARRTINQELVNEYLDMIDRPPLDIPNWVREHFRAMDEGYELRWVRFKDSKNGEEDVANVNKRLRLKYTFVHPNELPPEYASSFKDIKDSRTGKNIVTVEEMALMKLPLEYYEAFKEAQRQKTLDASQGILDATLNDKRFRSNFYTPRG